MTYMCVYSNVYKVFESMNGLATQTILKIFVHSAASAIGILIDQIVET